MYFYVGYVRVFCRKCLYLLDRFKFNLIIIYKREFILIFWIFFNLERLKRLWFGVKSCDINVYLRRVIFYKVLV